MEVQQKKRFCFWALLAFLILMSLFFLFYTYDIGSRVRINPSWQNALEPFKGQQIYEQEFAVEEGVLSAIYLLVSYTGQSNAAASMQMQVTNAAGQVVALTRISASDLSDNQLMKMQFSQPYATPGEMLNCIIWTSGFEQDMGFALWVGERMQEAAPLSINETPSEAYLYMELDSQKKERAVPYLYSCIVMVITLLACYPFLSDKSYKKRSREA